jgi:hypothetical protein
LSQTHNKTNSSGDYKCRPKSVERAGDKTGQLRPIEEDKMQFVLVDLLILSVGRVEDDTDVIPVRAAFSKL